ncbi:MAG TPA: metallophosphoesterase [Pyrinomonadaceae bacterium]|jgi:UDP-2,3-diacylglucosamine pyrophosphatase LpxH
MWHVRDVIVLSDLHLSSDSPGRGLFGADEALEEFLLWTVEQTSHCAVVLNGDVLDFLFAESRPGLDPVKLEREVGAIVESHRPVFKALGKLARSPRHSLVIISGNHDPELIFQGVRLKIEAALGANGRRPSVTWLVHGEALALAVGHARLLVEHGDRLDSWNEIDRENLSSAAGLGSRGLIDYHKYAPPPGSKLVSDHLLSLRGSFPWVELLKPEREAMLPLLRLLTTFREKSEHAAALNLYLQAEVRSGLTKLRQWQDPAARFRRGDDAGSLGGKLRAMAQAAVQTRGELKRAELITQLREAARNDTFFREDVPDGDYAADLQFLLRKGASDLLIHGHTHSAKAYPVGRGMYFNSGTWARLLRLPGADDGRAVWDEFLKSIETNQYDVVERPTFVRVTLDHDETTKAALHLWPREEPLALWHFAERRWVDQRRGF